LVGSEVALSVVLLVTAGLLLRTVVHLLRTDPGFDTRHLISASVWLPVPNDPKSDPYGTQGQRVEFVRAVERRLQLLPGVSSAALSSALPIKSRLGSGGFRTEGQAETNDAIPASLVLVTPDYFRTLNTPLVRGRMFQASEDDRSPYVVVVDQSAAKRFWPAENAIGKRLRFSQPLVVDGKAKGTPWLTVVGVVPDVKYRGLEDTGAPHVYMSMYQLCGKLFGVLVRGEGDAAALARAVQREVQAVDANLPVAEIMTMNDVVAASVSERRFSATLVGAFAGLALLLASIGVYGVASYTVAQRTRELGIRVALGATHSELLRQVLREGMAPVLGGALAGAAIGLVSSKLLASLMFGVSPTDPLVFATAIVTLSAAALLANLLPARRAARVDPMVALRCE
jgi:predicted permease